MCLADKETDVAGDDNINMRVSALEQQMSAMAADLTMIRLSGATKQDVAGVVAQIDLMKFEIDRIKLEIDRVKFEIEHIKADIDHIKVEIDHIKVEIDRIKQEFVQMRTQFAELRADFAVLKQQLDSEFSHMATKAELQQIISSSRNWLVGTAFTLFFALATLQLTVFSLARTLSAAAPSPPLTPSAQPRAIVPAR